MLTVQKVKENGWLIFEVITGSRSYGLNTEKSDTDIKGVFVLPKEQFYSLDYVPQVANASNDIVYYELRRFMELLSKSNPNIIEMLSVPDACLLQLHPLMKLLKPNLYLSKQCEQSFANYAYTQVKKAFGLEKKIVNPVAEERKSVLDFCFVYEGSMAVTLARYLEREGKKQECIGLSAISHLKNCYNMYYSDVFPYSGVMRKEASNDICLSSIPRGEVPVGMIYFNKEGYSTYCKTYKEYWGWVAKRNEERYKTTMLHGRNYDAKNMMHVFRLLRMAKEIALEGKVNVVRNDRDFLLSIKNGKYTYDELLGMAEQLKAELPLLYKQAEMPNEPSVQEINEILIKMRSMFYEQFDIIS